MSLFIIFCIGAVDDKINLNPNLKLLLLTILLSCVLYLDNTLLIENLRFSFLENNISLGKYSFVFTILCFLLFINACNMFDGINLQSTTYFIILCTFIISLSSENYFLFFFLINLLFIFKLNSSGKIFMGDSGIYISSFFLAFLIIKNYKINLDMNADLIFILMMLPGIDMFRLFILRIFNGKKPFQTR